MLFGWFYYDWTMLILLPALIFTLWAQVNVNSTFKKYSKMYSKRGITASQAARRMLDNNGLQNVRIERVSGHLTDHYDPRNNVIRLSDSVHDSTSAASIGVACHEAGHAVQYANGYTPIKIRSLIIPVTQFGSSLAMPIFLIGLLFSLDFLLLAGIALYSLVTIFQLVTLPVEFNASARGMEAIRQSGAFDEEECRAARKVLTAAAMTYVAALASSLFSLLRLIVIARHNSDNK